MRPTTQRKQHAANVGRRGGALVAVLAALALLAPGCGDDGGSSGGGTQELTIAVQSKILQTYYPQLAEKLGYLKAEGIKVRVIESQNPSGSIQALAGGSLDMFLGGPEALPAAAKGADMRFVAAGSNRSIWDIVTTKDVSDLKDLEGKEFGVSATTSISTATSKQALKAQGVDPDSLKYVVAGGTGNRYTALESGQIAAAPLGIPVNYQAVDSGKLKDFGVTDSDLGAPPIAAVVLTVSKRWADDNHEVLVSFLRAYQKVIDALYDPKQTDKIVDAASADIKVEPKYMRRAVETLFLEEKGDSPVLPRDGHIDVEALQNAADAFTELGVLPSKVDVTKYVDMSYLEEAQKSLEGG
jgi:NitT/TauT family transport system substrate-binding protein